MSTKLTNMDSEAEARFLNEVWGDYIEEGRQYINNDGEKVDTQRVSEQRVESLSVRKEILENFWSGDYNVQEFKEELDGESKKHSLFGYGGTSGAMFFNLLFNASERQDQVDELESLLRDVTHKPENKDEAEEKIERLRGYVENLRNDAENKRKAPSAGYIPYFLSYIWHIQDHENIPVYYKSGRVACEKLNVWEASESLSESYLRFWGIIEALKQSVEDNREEKVNLWDVEYALAKWERNESKEGPDKESDIGTEGDETTRHFWVNTKGHDWTHKFYSSKTSNGNPRRKEGVFEHASEGDKVVFFGIAPLQRIVGFGEVSEGMHKEEHEDHEEPVEGITVSLEESASGPDWEEIRKDPQLQESVPVRSNNHGIMVAELEKDEYERLIELFQGSIELTEVPDEIQISTTGLHFPEEKKDEMIRQVTRAIENGNHVLLVGPPGTGKSKLAKAVCESVMGDKYEFVTATSDWTTFDTVGGYHPEKDEKLVFKPGVFLSRFKDNQGNPQNEWLVVDEINRADIDKAFGSLFSVLAGDDATLSFTDRSERNIRILCNGDPEQGTAENVYYVPDDWRMVATMNTLDKTSLYEMSYAFMRRWAFVSVPVPEIPEDNDEAAELVDEYVDVWRDDKEDGDEDKYTDIAELWRVVNKRREIGPAIVKDIYEHVENDPNPDYASALSMHVIPQLEGLRENELGEFVTDLENTEVDVDTDRVKGFVEDYFQVDV